MVDLVVNVSSKQLNKFQDIYKSCNDKSEEEVVITYSNTFVKPNAMMIESVHTFVANCAMTSIFVTKNFASWTEVDGLEVFAEDQE